MVLPARDLQFIVDELPPHRATQAANQKCGCRVVQRLLERCPPGMMSSAIDGILADFVSVARSPYGNYVAQHVTEYASEEQRRRAMRAICADVKGLAADPFGSAVIFGALTRGPAAEQEMLAQTLLREPGLLAFMATTRHGSGCARRCLQLLRGRHLACARQQLLPELACLKASRFGRFVAQVLEGPQSSVARSPYGNYVAQHLTEYAPEEQRRRAMRAICADMKGLATDPFGSAVILGALTRGPAAEQELLAQALVREPGLIAFMATARHGSGCARRCLQLLRGQDLACARQQLRSELACLQASRFGRFVAQAL
eukprot:CAMPEP_0198610070 /NCGR_PEP_ID=MMETSP1462-20131121/156713_1 /TAXON_ID=1333877 /ORGANISM="Brandtodinium nutriculum, Strain RCC3387" /LENGTH=314 /DNA_ID=CAMNT_0044341877 /DNA_START=39 /DNA_END=984 /DNA_ORIENTATION=+